MTLNLSKIQGKPPYLRALGNESDSSNHATNLFISVSHMGVRQPTGMQCGLFGSFVYMQKVAFIPDEWFYRAKFSLHTRGNAGTRKLWEVSENLISNTTKMV